MKDNNSLFRSLDLFSELELKLKNRDSLGQSVIKLNYVS